MVYYCGLEELNKNCSMNSGPEQCREKTSCPYCSSDEVIETPKETMQTTPKYVRTDRWYECYYQGSSTPIRDSVSGKDANKKGI